MTRHARAIRFMETYCIVPKGVGAGKPMHLHPFQKELLESVLATGITSAVVSFPRGNGKSTLQAGMATWALFDSFTDEEPQVPIVATKVSQAMRSVYNVAVSMIERSPQLKDRCISYTGFTNPLVKVPYNRGEMFPTSNDEKGLQGLDPSLAIMDEIGFQEPDAWNSLVQATGKRQLSLVWGMGTPGTETENALRLLRDRMHAGAVIPGFHFDEFAADENCDLADRDQWRKANPALVAGFLQEAALLTDLELMPEARFRCFRLGQTVDGTTGWLGADGRDIWEALRDPWTMVERGPAWMGVDIGLKRDTSAVATVQYREDGRLHAHTRIWTPKRDEPVDVTDVMAYIREEVKRYQVGAIAYDPRFFDVPAKMLQDEGMPMVDVPQSLEHMTPVAGALYELIRKGGLSHDGDKAFTQHILNVVTRLNDRGFVMSKGKSKGAIDAAIALGLAVDRAQHRKKPRGRVVVG